MHGLDEYDSEARWYYPAIMRTTTIDPHAENYYSTSPYAWCGNNPANRIDPDGRDWFVNNDNGELIFLKGVSELSDDLRKQYNLGDSKFENIGKDNMFGDKVGYKWIGDSKLNEVSNILDFKFATFNEYHAGLFMGQQGFSKAEKLSIEEMKITEREPGENGKINTDERFSLQVKNRDVTYVKRNQFNNNPQYFINDYGNKYRNFSEIQTVNYNSTIPYGQSPYKTAYYNQQRSAANINKGLSAIEIIVSYVIDKYIVKRK